MATNIDLARSELETYRKLLQDTEANLKDDPSSDALAKLKEAYQSMVDHYESEIRECEKETARQNSASTSEEWSKEDHPAYQAGFTAKGSTSHNSSDDAGQVNSFKVNDMVLAKWQGDRSFYPARITAITGSSSNPQYYVKFKTYDNTEILRGADIKPIALNQSNKRKADGTPVNATPPPPPPPPPPPNGNVISAAASIDPDLANQARNDPNKASDGNLKAAKAPRKARANRELEAGKSKWQDFSKGKVGKVGKKDSMFRTPDGINARVGFTGSGQAMRKDPSRSRHLYQPEDD